MTWSRSNILRVPENKGNLPERERIASVNLRLAVFFFVVAPLLGSCAAVGNVKEWLARETNSSTGSERPTIPPQPIASPPKPRPQTHEPAKPEKSERLASVEPDSLIGMEPPAIEKILGSPTRVSQSDVSLVWTYAGTGCSFQIFFYPDLKSSTFHALKYGGTDGSGGPMLTSQTCIRDILTSKISAPG
jgi:hypothetical protein